MGLKRTFVKYSSKVSASVKRKGLRWMRALTSVPETANHARRGSIRIVLRSSYVTNLYNTGLRRLAAECLLMVLITLATNFFQSSGESGGFGGSDVSGVSDVSGGLDASVNSHERIVLLHPELGQPSRLYQPSLASVAYNYLMPCVVSAVMSISFRNTISAYCDTYTKPFAKRFAKWVASHWFSDLYWCAVKYVVWFLAGLLVTAIPWMFSARSLFTIVTQTMLTNLIVGVCTEEDHPLKLAIKAYRAKDDVLLTKVKAVTHTPKAKHRYPRIKGFVLASIMSWMKRAVHKKSSKLAHTNKAHKQGALSTSALSTSAPADVSAHKESYTEENHEVQQDQHEQQEQQACT